jgi:hypothetical protein
VAALSLIAVAALAQETGLRDPMRPFEPVQSPAVEVRTAASPYSLTAVFVSSTRRIAVINGQPCHEGDEVDGAIVTRIDERSVALERAGRETVLRLPVQAAGVRTHSGESSR